MKQLIQKIKAKLHVHCHNQPIVSQYWTFHSRRIVYQCRCGHKQLFKVHEPFDVPFPLETISITNKEIESILAIQKPLPQLDHLKMLQLLYL